jgi:hypothetical protein
MARRLSLGARIRRQARRAAKGHNLESKRGRVGLECELQTIRAGSDLPAS